MYQKLLKRTMCLSEKATLKINLKYIGNWSIEDLSCTLQIRGYIVCTSSRLYYIPNILNTIYNLTLGL